MNTCSTFWTKPLRDSARQVEKDSFLLDETLKRAFVRSIEVIGEAVKRVPETGASSD